jgi:hypothetical protein
MIFYDEQQKTAFNEICGKMKKDDCYHRSIAYLLALDVVLREHINDVFDFQEDVIKPEGLHKGFQTGTSKKTTRLAFNLWSGCYDDGETYIDKDGYETPLPSNYYTPEQIFCCVEYAPYYWQAIKIRFEF